MQNLGTLQQLSHGDLADDGRRERGGERRREEEKIMRSLMATLLRWRMHSGLGIFQIFRFSIEVEAK
jgi:hypothetical protein